MSDLARIDAALAKLERICAADPALIDPLAPIYASLTALVWQR